MKLKRISDFSEKNSVKTNEGWFDSAPSARVHGKDKWFDERYPGIARTDKEDQLMELIHFIQDMSLKGDRLEVLDVFLGSLIDNKNILKPIIR